MASLQLLPSQFHAKFGSNFCSEFKADVSVKSSLRLHNSGFMLDRRKFKISCKVEESDSHNKGEETPESLFTKELRRRGMTPTSLLEEKNRCINRGDNAEFREENGGRSYSRRKGVIVDAERNISKQRETSMALNSEGLEGLVPRAKRLLTLGGTFFLGFWPLILATVAFCSALYLYFGPEFIHDGSTIPIGPPQYVDPFALLEEERI